MDVICNLGCFNVIAHFYFFCLDFGHRRDFVLVCVRHSFSEDSFYMMFADLAFRVLGLQHFGLCVM